jgi:hypothetical protein
MENIIRRACRWRSAHFNSPLHKKIMKTSGTVKDDILRSIQQYSEVTDLGYDLLQRQSHPDSGTSFKRFQAYIRQGLTFFGAADQTHYRASPLLYYYAFMNLAKAIVFLYDHGFTAGHIYHGLTPAPGTGNFRDHFIKVKTSGVFQSFYKQILGENIATETKLGVLGLLSYISDLTYEHRFFNLGESSSYPCKYAVVQWEGEEQYRGLIAAGVVGASKSRLQEILWDHFSEVGLYPASAEGVFELRFEEITGFTFWETKNLYSMPTTESPETDLLHALGSHFSQNPFADSFLLRINARMQIEASNQICMNEAIAIYALMFYFGSLVRYHPQILEEMLTRKEAQIIESFVKSTPITFLRYMRNALDGNYFAYTQR